MPRTTKEQVKLIIEVPGALTDAMIDSFIADASLLVTEKLADTGQTAARLELIERYLAAHFIVLLTERGGLLSQEVDDVRETYAGPKNGTSLGMSRYGQQAIVFDESGTLKAMATPTTALKGQFRVL